MNDFNSQNEPVDPIEWTQDFQVKPRKGPLIRIVAALILAAITYGIVRLAPEALNKIQMLINEFGWNAILTSPRTLISAALLASEGVLAISLATIALTSEEENWVNWIAFILIAIGTIILEVLSLVLLVTPAFWIVFFTILASVLVLLGTAFTIWKDIFIALRRWLCSTLFPTQVGFFVWIFDTYVACAKWGIRSFEVCGQWVARTTTECVEWMQKTTRNCIQWGTNTTRECQRWGTRTTRTCKTWIPGFLGDLICFFWQTIVSTVCISWLVVTTTVCIAWAVIVTLVCVVWSVLTVLVCLIWWIIVEIFCLLFLAVLIVVAIIWFIILIPLRIFFFC